MKYYFKHANGYSNINEENLFLTNSGNWSETQALEEKSVKTNKENSRRNLKFDFFIFVLIIFIAFAVYNFINGVVSKGLPVLLIIATLGVYRYFQNETGKRIKIPLSKIIAFEILENTAKITFYNSINEKDSEELKKIEPKGIQILRELNLRLFSSSV